MTKKYPAIIPAGSQPGYVSELAKLAGVTNKSLIPLNGKPIISYTVEALDKAELIESITIVGLSEEDIKFETTKPLEYVPSEGTNMDTIITASHHFEAKENPPEYVLTVSSDIPFITSEIVDKNIKNIPWELNKDGYIPVIFKEQMLDQFPEAHKRFRKFKEGTITIADFLAYKPKALLYPPTLSAITKIVDNRKTIIKMLLKFTKFGTLKFLFGRFSLETDAIGFFRKALQTEIEMVVSTDGALAMDLDYPEDLEIFQRLLRSVN
ncbi:MAG: NTP transferase domain-containing protein [Candidatus Heimdallarchaeota archaeon]|nr:NTP transferase domain-containing protein [Candidatus Heimdallarchaeota archaeon]